MAVRVKKLNRKTNVLDSATQRWLAGEKGGFFQFKPVEELQAIWDAFGDEESLFWRKGMACPITQELLAEFEEDWISSADNGDEHGARSYFIHRFYDDEEKAELAKRGNVTWRPCLRRPEAI
jgi:hypothetical protein